MATDARSANRNYPVPHSGNLISEDFPRLITALGMIDTDIDSLFTSMSGKASASHTHPISEIDGLQAALEGKAATGHTHSLGDLNNVSTGGAGSGQYLGFNGTSWQPITVQISHVSGLQGALNTKADLDDLIDALAGLSDVDLTTNPPVTGDGFVFNGTKWVPGPAGGGMFKGDNGTVGSRSGDIFRVNAKTLNTNTTIGATENASATGPLEIASGVTLTVEVGGTLAIL